MTWHGHGHGHGMDVSRSDIGQALNNHYYRGKRKRSTTGYGPPCLILSLSPNSPNTRSWIPGRDMCPSFVHKIDSDYSFLSKLGECCMLRYAMPCYAIQMSMVMIVIIS